MQASGLHQPQQQSPGGLASTGSFNCCVECQQVCLIGDSGDYRKNRTDVVTQLSQLID